MFRLPVFPLGLVLLPGAAMPLHLFEPRYRQLLTDIQQTDKRFGIVYAMPGASERELPAGRAGCVAEVVEVETLPDGRSNILVIGRERFELERIVDDEAPYQIAEVTTFDDTQTTSHVAVAVVASEVVERFNSVVDAVQILGDNDTIAPELPDDPAKLAFAIGAMIDLELPQRQELLAERSVEKRLNLVDGVLRRALPDLELRAAMHKQGKTANPM